MHPSYPHPLVVPSLKGDEHSHTIILLHGRGSNSERFGHTFIESTGIAKYLPTTKFVFPTAKKRRSTVLKRVPINQWFDNYSLENPNTRTELQLDGLQESSEFLRTLIDNEAKLLSRNLNISNGYSRVIVGGLSQGCAASMFCLLGGFPPTTEERESKRLGAFIGMSGWLPLEEETSGILKINEDDEQKSETEAGEHEDDDDPFASDADDGGDDIPVQAQAVNHIRDVLDLPPIPSGTPTELDGVLHVPVFLGHGSADPKVSVSLGQRMALILSSGFGMDVTWRAYEEFGHWYRVPEEIDDVVPFLKDKVAVPVSSDAKNGPGVAGGVFEPQSAEV